MFTLEEARDELARLLPTLDEFVAVRADTTELGAVLSAGGRSERLGGLPEFKAAQARLEELMSELRDHGADLKGIAPLLLDFPSELDGEPVLLCWLEGDRELLWYHRLDTGFAGRRRIPPTP
jgi:hypothetical protein